MVRRTHGKTNGFCRDCKSIWDANSDGRWYGILYLFHMEICDDTNQTKLGATFTVLVALIDRIRMLDNDLIRLDQKLNIFIEMDEEIQKRKRDEER